MSGFTSAETGDFDKHFMTTTDLIDRYVVGNLWTCGYNNYGQLGDNTTTAKSSPIQTIAGGTNWKSVSAGFSQTLAIKTDGTLWAWGRNSAGQLGDNSIIYRSSPVQTIAGGNNWKYVSSGSMSEHTFAISEMGDDF